MKFLNHYLSEDVDPTLSKKLDSYFASTKTTDWKQARWITPSGMMSRGKHFNNHNATAMDYFGEFDVHENWIEKLLELGPIRMFTFESPNRDGRSYVYFHVGHSPTGAQETAIRQVYEYGGTSYYYKTLVDIDRSGQRFEQGQVFKAGEYDVDEVLNYIEKNYKQEAQLYKSLATQFHGEEVELQHAHLVQENVNPVVKKMASVVAGILGIRFDGIWDSPELEQLKDKMGILDFLQFTDAPEGKNELDPNYTGTSIIYRLPKGKNISTVVKDVKDKLNAKRIEFGKTPVPEIS